MLLMLTAVSGWAQESKASDEKTLAPIVIEGNVERVPDGTVVMVGGRMGGFCSYGPNQGDTLRNGKFRIIYTPDSPTDEYLMTAMYNGAQLRHYFMFYASPGTKATIKGEGIHPANWYAKSDNPKQIEANEYRAYLDEKLPRYWDLQEKRDRSTVEAESLYVEYMIEFMKDRKYSSVFASNLCTLSLMILEGKNKNMGIRGRAAKLLAIVPKDAPYDEFINRARKYLLPKYEPIKIGEKLHDFVLYDHQDKEHHLTEFNGNGKYLLLEFNSRTCVPCVKHRPNEVLNNLYKNHSDKVDMLMVNCDAQYYWDIECKDPNKYGRDPWHEWNDKKNAEDIMQRYGTETGPSYFFVSPDGTILGRISDQEDLKAAIAKYFKI